MNRKIKLVILIIFSALLGVFVTYNIMHETLSETAHNVMVRESINFARENIKYIKLLENKEYCLAYNEMRNYLSNLNNPLIESCSRGNDCWEYFTNEALKIMPDINDILYRENESKMECDCKDEVTGKISNCNE